VEEVGKKQERVNINGKIRLVETISGMGRDKEE
jgi:hypothetical protein